MVWLGPEPSEGFPGTGARPEPKGLGRPSERMLKAGRQPRPDGVWVQSLLVKSKLKLKAQRALIHFLSDAKSRSLIDVKKGSFLLSFN